MKVVSFALALLLASPAFGGGTKPEFTIGQSVGEYRSQVYKPDSTSPTGYKSYRRNVDLNGYTASLGVRTVLTENMTLRTALGSTFEFSEDLLEADRFLQASVQNTIYSFQGPDATCGERVHLSFGLSGHRLKTGEGYITSVGILAGGGLEHFSDGIGWNLAVEQNETLQSTDLELSNGNLVKNNHTSYLNYTAGANYYF